MKRIRTIFSALSTLRRVPSAAIADAWANIAGSSEAHEDVGLIDSLISAIVAIAKDDEDKAIAASKDDKP